MRVLVVEDNVRTAALLRQGLQEEGWAVDVVHGGRDALWMAESVDSDAIVLDLMLPDMDGRTVCRDLRRRGCWTPILMLTAVGATTSRAAGLDSGADDYVVKPFTFTELTARLRALARRGAAPRPAILRAGDLELDPAAHEVRLSGHEVTLSAKEFALLQLFMQHPGEVLSRTYIREKLWDFAYEGDSNVVDQYVSYLRRKIDRPFGRDSLTTIRGRGYRLVAPDTR